MEIPLNAQVECTDGVCGRSVYVLINPVLGKVSHLVVQADSGEYMVPVDLVTDTIAETIRLSCSKAELEKMNPFIKTEFIQEVVPDYATNKPAGLGTDYYMPYVVPLETRVYETEKDLQIPPGELAIHRGTRIEATDGFVGQLDEFVVNPDNCHITHLVMREGHLWGKKEVVIPISAMGDSSGDTVFLKLNKHEIESLPSFPVRRRWA